MFDFTPTPKKKKKIPKAEAQHALYPESITDQFSLIKFN